MQYSRERLIRWFHEGRARSREVFAIPRPESYLDRKSTRLNSSHSQISYAVFCLKKKTSVLVDAVDQFLCDKIHSLEIDIQELVEDFFSNLRNHNASSHACILDHVFNYHADGVAF